MRTFKLGLVLFGITFLILGQSASAALQGTTTRVGSGMTLPLFATYAPGDNSHLFVVEQGGAIKVLDLNTKTVLSAPFLTVPDTDPEGEGGLLGLAFHPNYNSPGKTGFGQFYVYVTVDNGGVPVPAGDAATATSAFSTHVRQYSVSTSNSLVANPSATEILSFPRPQSNHVGGWIGFSPKDGYLYINSGDGGNGDDVGAGHYEPGGNAQTITNNLLGKQLRIDVNSDAFADPNKNYAIPPTNPFAGAIVGDDEIWSYGLRNPFRSSFDRDTAENWIADVGQGAREEIDREPTRLTASQVANYGWRVREGTNGTGTVPNYVGPVYDYAHGSGTFQGFAVIGGYVYRGPDPSLQGTYFFADEGSGHKWTMNTTNYSVANIDALLTPNVGSISQPASFAEDAVGNLYMVAYGSGSVFKINTTQLLAGDYNASGTVDSADYILWRKTFGSTTRLDADGNHNGSIDNGDFTIWRNNAGTTVHTLGFLGAGVPEPAVALMGAQLAILLAMVRRRR